MSDSDAEGELTLDGKSAEPPRRPRGDHRARGLLPQAEVANDTSASEPDPSPCAGDARDAARASGDLAELLSTGDMARLSHSTLRAVRFYEQEGLIAPRVRTNGGHRKFDLHELKKLQMIVDLREAGLSVDEIRSLMALKRRCSTPECAAREMTEALLKRIDELQRKMDVLRRVREDLASTVELIGACRGCNDVRFPQGCGRCDLLAKANLPKAAHLLWNS